MTTLASYSIDNDAHPVLTQAWLITRQAGHNAITPEHLLLAILQTPNCRAVKLLRNAGIAIDRIETAVSAMLGIAAQPGTAVLPPAGEGEARLELSPEGLDIFLEASREGRHTGHETIDSTLILMGLLRMPRLPAASILQQNRVSLALVRERVELERSQSFYASNPAARPPAQRPPAAPSPYRTRMPGRSLPDVDWFAPAPIQLSPIFIAILAVTALAGVMAYLQFAARLAVFLFVVGGWVLSLCLHEFGHALVAYWGGDKSVADKGYLTFNPVLYTNSMYSIILPILFLIMGGIGLPGGAVYINTAALRSHRTDSYVSAAGPGMSLLCALVLSAPFLFQPNLEMHTEFWSALALLAFIEFTAVVINLLPIPGLDGFGILAPFLPENIRATGYALAGVGPMLLFALFYLSDPFNRLLWNVVFFFTDLFQINGMLIGVGFQLFRFWNNLF